MSNEPRCLENLRLIETKKKFLTRGLECLGDYFFVLSWSLATRVASAGHVGFECLRVEWPNQAIDFARSIPSRVGFVIMEMRRSSPWV